MNTSKIVVFSSANSPFHLEEVKIPKLKSGEILVKNEYTTLCRSDVNTFCGKRTEKTPTILGHEIVGRIVALDSDHLSNDLRGNALAIQDRITWGIYASDPNSELSKIGIPQKAPDLFKYGHERITEDSNLHGGLSEFTILRANTPVVKVQENIALKVAAIINCAVATIAGAIRLAEIIDQKKVLVSGAGMLGLIACAMSKAQGASKITVRDINATRIEQAKSFGADSGILVGAQGLSHVEEKYDLVIELSGVSTAMEDTLHMMSIGGKAVWVGATYPQADLRINAEKIVRNLWTIKGLHNYNSSDLITAVEFMEQYHQQYPFEEIIHDQFSLDEVNEAFAYALEHNPFRVGVKINV